MITHSYYLNISAYNRRKKYCETMLGIGHDEDMNIFFQVWEVSIDT